MKQQEKRFHITRELMDELTKLFATIVDADLKKTEFERGILYGQIQVIKKITQWKEAEDGKEQWS